jgi:hypothetical protein
LTSRIDSIAALTVLSVVVGGCGTAPTPTSSPSSAITIAATPVASTGPQASPSEASSALIERDQAVTIARSAAGEILTWLEGSPLGSAELTLFEDVRSSFDPMPVPDLPDDRLVWSIVLADVGSGQGATIYVDATNGAVLRSVTWIT